MSRLTSDDNSTVRQIAIVTDPQEIAEARHRREQFDRNSEWLQAHAREVYPKHRGRHICIAGQELFDGATAREAIDKAEAAHPEDQGRFVQYIPKENLPRIYAL